MYPKIYAENIFGAEIYGYYASIAMPAIIIQVAASFIFTPLIPVFSEYYLNKDYKQFKKLMLKITNKYINTFNTTSDKNKFLEIYNVAEKINIVIIPLQKYDLPIISYYHFFCKLPCNTSSIASLILYFI